MKLEIKGRVTVNGVVQKNQVTNEGVVELLSSIIGNQLVPLTNAVLLDGMPGINSSKDEWTFQDIKESIAYGCAMSRLNSTSGLTVKLSEEAAGVGTPTKSVICTLTVPASCGNFNPDGTPSEADYTEKTGAVLFYQGDVNQNLYVSGTTPNNNKYSPIGTEKTLAVIMFDELVKKYTNQDLVIQWEILLDNIE